MTVVPAADGGSVLTYDADLTLKGTFALANPFLGLFFDRIGDKGVGGLRTVLGGPAVATGPAPGRRGGRHGRGRRPRGDDRRQLLLGRAPVAQPHGRVDAPRRAWTANGC